ncbi:Fe-S cluster assembly protein SufB [Candidatus Pacearchaeota archaeon CG10_big_fil_rev_8_21_14_0_10_34_12]|nr:MAG: Fe-S cluster assembly protein SufB [Candidatus Pacearchaeota archaeon CG10_big_fil_rev_8_21_14_0_10_34_12]
MSKNKQKIFEISRINYDSHNPENLKFKAQQGLSEELIRKISHDKKEPEWMLDRRLKAFEIFRKKQMPDFGPSLDNLNLDEIYFYLKPRAKNNSISWEDVPSDIRKTYEKLGIPEAEKNALAGVGAQYESEVIYHNLKKSLAEKGVIFIDMDIAVKKYPEMVKKYFMTNCIPPTLHKFSALHGAVWSGGTFIYIPKGVKVNLPLQAYFRMNAEKGGQFEHTLIIADEESEVHYIEGCSAPKYSTNSLHAGCVEIHVLKNARVRYSSIENWSKNTYNLNTKRAIVHENAIMEWVNGNLGSKVTMLYPCSVLIGKNSKTDYVGIAYAGEGQYQDTGCKVYHLNSGTTSNVLSKGISKGGGISSYRGLVVIKKGAKNSTTSVRCDGLMLDNESKALTFPSMEVSESDVKVAHEATVGKIGEEQLFYLMSRGLSEEEAMKLIVSGFIEPLIKELPLEYAVELNRLIEMEIENSVC